MVLLFACLIKTKNDNEAAGVLRQFFKSNYHTQDPRSTKPAFWLVWLGITQLMGSGFFFFYSPIRILAYGFQFQYILGRTIQIQHSSYRQCIKELFIKHYIVTVQNVSTIRINCLKCCSLLVDETAAFEKAINILRSIVSCDDTQKY